MIHTTQDPRVIAGQGTLALEMLSQVQGKLDVIVIPIGGGGLISGCSTAIKAICPGVKIVGAKPDAINDRKIDQFNQKKPKMSKDEYTVCDGTRGNIGRYVKFISQCSPIWLPTMLSDLTQKMECH